MLIRQVRKDDLAEVVRIEQENFSEAEAASPEAMQERIAHIPDTFLIAELDGRLAGYIEGPVIKQRYLTDDLFQQVLPNPKKSGFIAVTSLSVDHEFKKQGIGTMLVGALKDRKSVV